MIFLIYRVFNPRMSVLLSQYTLVYLICIESAPTHYYALTKYI